MLCTNNRRMHSNSNTVYQWVNWTQEDLIVFIKVSVSSAFDFSQAWCNNIYSAAAFTWWTYLVRFTCPTDHIASAEPGALFSTADINSIHSQPSSQLPKHNRKISLNELNFTKNDFCG